MKKNTVVLFLAFASLVSNSQGVKTNHYDKFLKKQRVETNVFSVSGLPGKNKLAFGFTAIGSALYLNMNGSGWGTTTVDNGDELNLLFSNDSVITLKSDALQGFEPGMMQNSYRHQYQVTTNQLEALSKFDVVSIRKYSFKTFTDLKIPVENSAKLKKLSEVFVSELKKANIFKSLRQISVKDIRNYIGDSVSFCSRVYRTRYFNESAGGPTLLDVQADFSDPFINVVILEKDRSSFNGAPEKKYLEKDVCISGVLTLQNNIPYLVIHDRDQIKVTSPVSLDEIDMFVGDSITVTGKVFTARYLEDTKTKPTLLNVGAPYPDQPLTLVIENEDREKFGKPEENYFGKTLRVSGKLVQFKGKPQIILHNTKQVLVVADAEPQPATVSLQNETKATAKAEPESGKKEDKKTAAPQKEPAKPVAEQKAPLKPETETAEKKAPAQSFAEFPGGDDAFAHFIRENLSLPNGREIPNEKQVVISFDVDAKGVWRNMRLVTSADEELDKALIKVLRRMPKWKPAVQNGVAVATQVVYPISIGGAYQKK